MLLNKNSISLNLFARPEVVPYKKYKAVVSVDMEKDLKKAVLSLNKMDLSKKRAYFLKNYCYKVDGNASKRIIKKIRSTK